jgi:small nuclear ribonucleoprotein (snRNP)-like protein
MLCDAMQVTVQDGRVLVGDFVCLDKQGNMVLQNVVELYENDGRPEEKMLGSVVVPATQRTQCSMQAVSQGEADAVRAMVEQQCAQACADAK